MYSFMIRARRAQQMELAAVKGEDAYEFFTYDGGRPVELDFRGRPTVIRKGDRFGVRPSSNGKFIRLVLPNEITKVHTITLDQAKKLARGIRAEGK